ncbi:MAG: hypothetical protein ABJB74_15525 [Gemmatimonas sp.]
MGHPVAVGNTISLSINDAGRVGLAGQMGPNITYVEGRLVERDSSAYVLAVSQIQTFRDGTQVWSGERARIKSEFVNVANEKKFSRGKTAIVVGAAIGVIVAVASTSLLGILTRDNPVTPPDTASTTKIPIFIKR